MFFFGTLMDADVLRLVTGRDLTVEQAEIARFRRVFVHNRNYPMLVPHPSGRVPGMLAHDLDRDAVTRLLLFEGHEYHLVPLRVLSNEGHPLLAGTFLCDRVVLPGHQEWHLSVWQRRFKRPFLRRAAELMQRYGTKARLRRDAGGMPVVAQLAPKPPKMLSGMPQRERQWMMGVPASEVDPLHEG
ncbi:MAG: gamma-glutamylcyclotransferase [Rhodospirillales bacterium]|nr:gamma-glutamylcyclotransferase [Rhodospirillales bacterium]